MSEERAQEREAARQAREEEREAAKRAREEERERAREEALERARKEAEASFRAWRSAARKARKDARLALGNDYMTSFARGLSKELDRRKMLQPCEAVRSHILHMVRNAYIRIFWWPTIPTEPPDDLDDAPGIYRWYVELYDPDTLVQFTAQMLDAILIYLKQVPSFACVDKHGNEPSGFATLNIPHIFPEDMPDGDVLAHRVRYNDKELEEDFRTLVAMPLPFSIPTEKRMEHELIVAKTGHGKSRLLENQLVDDIYQDDPPGIILIDSKGTMVSRLSRLNIFNPIDGAHYRRLLIIDPVHDDIPLGMFDFDLKGSSEEAVNETITEVSHYCRSLLGSELSSTMGGLINPLVQLMVKIPGASFTTLLDAINDIHREPFQSAIPKLPPVARRFLTEDYDELIRPDTRKAVKRRLYELATMSPSFERMFFAKHNMVNLAQALIEKRIILISTALPDELSAIFGKYWISRIIAAARARGVGRHPPTFLYIDEAKDYCDDRFEKLVNKLRDYRLGGILAFQQFEQVPAEYRAALMNVTTKIVGGNYHAGATMLSHELNTTPAFIFSQHRDEQEPPRYTRFAAIVNNTGMKSAVSMSVPIWTLDNQDQMEDELYDLLREINRRALRPPPEDEPEESDEDDDTTIHTEATEI